jgi:thiol-disulfide isomerase/thioredoxin
MDASQSQQGYPVRTLCYESYSPHGQMSMCLMVGLAALVVFLTLSRPTSPVYSPMAYQTGTHITSMLATVGEVVSARASAVGGTVADHVKQTAASVVGAGGSVMKAKHAATTKDHVPPTSTVTLIDARKSKHDAEAWQSLSEKEKASVEKDVRAYLKSHENAAVMCFAPWCHHCKSAMPEFAAVAVDTPGREFVMINAEALPRSAFQGPNKLCPLEFFPSYGVAKAGKIQNVSSPQELAGAQTAETKDHHEDHGTEDGIEHFLDGLF